MSEKKIRAFEEIGYVKKLPKGSDINDYESIKIKINNGEKLTLYRNLSEKKEIDDTSNFGSSWDVFNSLL
jgi:hypothetical protein